MYDIADHRKIAEFTQKHFGKTYTGNFLESLYPQKEQKIEETSEFVPILNTRYDQRGEPIYLDLSEQSLNGGQPIIVFAPMGQGKTVFILNLVEELIKANYAVINLSDFKNDAYYAQNFLQTKFRKFLPFWKHPSYTPYGNWKLRIRCYMPEFLAKDSSINIPTFRLSISDFSKDDLIKSFLDLDPNDPQARILWKLYNYVFKFKKPSSVEELMIAVLNVNQVQTSDSVRSFYTPATIQILRDKLDNYKMEGVFGDSSSTDFIGDMLQGFYVSICFDSESRETNIRISQAYISAIMNKIEQEKKNGRLLRKKIFMFFDDATEIATPPRKIPSSKSAIYRMCRVGRAKDISPVIITQSLSELGKQFLNKARYIIFFSGISGSDLELLSNEKLGDYSKILEDFELGKGPDRISNRNHPYDGARKVMVWINDGSNQGKGNTFTGWVPMPSCSVPVSKVS